MTRQKAYADLHVHTNYSDGTFTPEEAVRFAKAAALAAISITDHDTTGGIEAAMAEGERCGVEVLPGIELSAEYTKGASKNEVHILGYLIDWKNEAFQRRLGEFRAARKERAAKIVDKLKASGVQLDEAHLAKMSGIGTVGRLHFAKVMVEDGIVPNISEAFQRFLGYGKPAYVPKFALTPPEAIKMISDVGGIPVLAHPLYVYYNNNNIISELSDMGLKGVEVWHSKHPQNAVKIFADIAFELGLISTGGSDCHGMFAGESAIMGKVKVPYRAVQELKNFKNKHK